MTLHASEWAAQQWATVELGDRRLTRRAVEMGTQMAAHPEASLPEQMGAPSVLKAAYGLLNHPGVSLAALTAPHRQQTLQAAGALALVLQVEDTTELDFTHHPSKTGLAPIGNGGGRGLLLHSTLAIEPGSRTLLGLAHAQVVLRQPKAARPQKWVRTPEGRVWEVSAQQVGRPPAGACWVHVSDCGSDIFEYMATCRQQDKHFLIRAFRNRRLQWAAESPEATDATAQAVLDYARSLPPAVPTRCKCRPRMDTRRAPPRWCCNGRRSPCCPRCRRRPRFGPAARSKCGWCMPGNPVPPGCRGGGLGAAVVSARGEPGGGAHAG